MGIDEAGLVHSVCVDPDQLTACDGLAEANDCVFVLGDTWWFADGVWTNAAPAPAIAPPARSDSPLVYDRKRGRMLLFGG